MSNPIVWVENVIVWGEPVYRFRRLHNEQTFGNPSLASRIRLSKVLNDYAKRRQNMLVLTLIGWVLYINENKIK